VVPLSRCPFSEAMKKIFLLLLIVLAIQWLPAQPPGDSIEAPLFVFTNGRGQIYPNYDGEMLKVGRRYRMKAVPENGYRFASWEPVNVFIITQTNFTALGEPILPPVVSIVPSDVPTYTYRPDLKFTMKDIIWISPDGSNPNIIRAFGWQANFVPWYQPVPRPPNNTNEIDLPLMPAD
jgi:hypothetical protein